MSMRDRLVLLLCVPFTFLACERHAGKDADAEVSDGQIQDAAPVDAGADAHADAVVPTCSASSLVEVPVALAAGEQVVPNAASSADGTLWVSWYDNAQGNYDVRLQLLSPLGEPLLDPTGLLVSEHASESWVTGHSLAVDPDGAAIVAFNDVRTGHFEPFAYRVDADGQQRWGEDGIALAPHAADGVFPKIAITTAGEAVFVFERFDDGQDLHEAVLQRLSAEGTRRWGSEGIIITSATGQAVVRPWIAAADLDSVIVVWLETPDIMSYDRTIMARKVNREGSAVWAEDAVVSEGGSLPYFYDPVLEPDGQGGLFVAWQEIDGNRTVAKLQHLDAEGATTMTTGGVGFSTSTTRMQLRPSLAWVVPAQEVLAVWRETDLDQSVYGLAAQRVTHLLLDPPSPPGSWS